MLDLIVVHKLNVGLIFLDQEKTFDIMVCDYIFRTPEASRFGPYFIAGIKLLYTDVYLLKINGTLTRPSCIRWPEKVLDRSKKWEWICPQLSTEGRSLRSTISMLRLWLWPAVLHPPDELFDSPKESFMNAF